MTDLGAVILAGGRSRRFGRDKLAEQIDGRPLLDHAIEAVRPLVSGIVVVVAPEATLDVPEGVAWSTTPSPSRAPSPASSPDSGRHASPSCL